MHPKGNEEANDVRCQWQEIARSEVMRQRRRLALLSDEQRIAVESVLVSVTDHMFDMMVQGAENCADVDRCKCFDVWRREPIAA